MRPKWFELRIAGLLPLLVVLLFVLMSLGVRDTFMLCKTGMCNEPIPNNLRKVLQINAKPEAIAVESPDASKDAVPDRKSTALKYGGRLTWSFLAGVNLFVYVLSIAAVLIILYRMFPAQPATYILLVVLALCFLVGHQMFTNKEKHMAIFIPLFEDTLKQDVPRIIEITNLMNSIGNAVAFALILCSCAILLRGYDKFAPQGLKDLSATMKSLRLILYVGTFLLVATVLLKKSLYQWSLAFNVGDDKLTKPAESFFAAVLSIEGGFYTLMLASLYLPAAYLVQRRAEGLNGMLVKEKENLKGYGLSFSFADSVPRILAILGPLLAGPIGELFKGTP